MATRRKQFGSLFFAFALLMALSPLAGPRYRAYAAGSRVITSSDLGDFSGVESAAGSSIAGVTYKQAMLLAFNKSYATLFTGKFPGYAAFTTAVGVPDGTADDHAGTVTIVVTVDGKPFKTITKSYGQAATMLTVPFGHASQIKLTVRDNQSSILYVLLGNPSVTTVAPRAVATPEPIAGNNNGNGNGGGASSSGTAGAGKTTVKLFSPSVGVGSQETALISTGHGAELTVVITYPGGSQQVLGPKKAGADGNFAYTWTIPSGVAGTARITVVSNTVVTSTFTIK
jgi:hypothetical protein